MHPHLTIAIRAARNAGSLIIKHFDRADNLDVRAKGYNDLVSKVDREAEANIIDIIKRSYPDHGILAEESGIDGNNEYQWIIDPLDGTTNYLHGLPHFAVSIALMHKGQPEQAVVYDPIRDELFKATQGQGSYLNNRRIRVSKQKGLKGALLGTGFPFKNHDRLDQYISIFREYFPKSSGVRRAGSAALDLAYIASGRLDGFWEMGLQPWDMAAGILLIKEAGGIICDLNGENNYYESGDIMTGNPYVVDDMLEAINKLHP